MGAFISASSQGKFWSSCEPPAHSSASGNGFSVHMGWTPIFIIQLGLIKMFSVSPGKCKGLGGGSEWWWWGPITFSSLSCSCYKSHFSSVPHSELRQAISPDAPPQLPRSCSWQQQKSMELTQEGEGGGQIVTQGRLRSQVKLRTDRWNEPLSRSLLG